MNLTGRPREVIRRMFEENRAVGRTGKEFRTSHTSIPPSVGDYLTGLADRIGAERTIEIGLGLGVASIFLVAGRPRGTCAHTAVDPYQNSFWDGAGMMALEQAGLADSVHLVHDCSEYSLPLLARQGVRFDLAFIDGNHHFEHVMMDLFHLGRCLAEGGRIVVDDVHLPSVQSAVDFFVLNVGWRVADRPGLRDDLARERLLVLEPHEGFERPWNHFVRFL